MHVSLGEPWAAVEDLVMPDAHNLCKQFEETISLQQTWKWRTRCP